MPLLCSVRATQQVERRREGRSLPRAEKKYPKQRGSGRREQEAEEPEARHRRCENNELCLPAASGCEIGADKRKGYLHNDRGRNQ